MKPIILILAGVVIICFLSIFYRRGKEAEKEPITYEQFIEQLSRQIDQNMLNEENKKGIVMYGGECEVSIPDSDPDNVTMKIVLYGKESNNSDKWIKNNITQKLSVSEFSSDEDTAAKLEALRSKPEKFKIEKPEKE